MSKVDSFETLLLAEAGGKTKQERYNDMLAIASVVENRSRATGKTIDEVISAPGQFSAWGRSLPKGVDDVGLRNLAQEAIKSATTVGPVNNALYYATPKAADNLPKGLQHETQTAGHVFYSDPQARAIGTAAGYVKPDLSAMAHPAAPARNNPATALTPIDFGNLPTRSVRTESLPVSQSTPVAERTITPGLGLANLAPPDPAAPGNRGAVSYAHPDRGPWSAGLQPEAVDAVGMMATRSPTGLAITSGYRSPAVNAAVGGAKASQHMAGRAFDVNLAGLSWQERADMVESARMAGATRLGAYSKHPDMLHVDFGKGWQPNRGTVHAMMDETDRNMSRAPSWFTAGLDQVSVPVPTPRPDDLTTPRPDDLTAIARAPLAGLPSPALGARAASELQGFAPGSFSLPGMPAELASPPSIAQASRDVFSAAQPAFGAAGARDLASYAPATPSSPLGGE